MCEYLSRGMDYGVRDVAVGSGQILETQEKEVEQKEGLCNLFA